YSSTFLAALFIGDFPGPSRLPSTPSTISSICFSLGGNSQNYLQAASLTREAFGVRSLLPLFHARVLPSAQTFKRFTARIPIGKSDWSRTPHRCSSWRTANLEYWSAKATRSTRLSLRAAIGWSGAVDGNLSRPNEEYQGKQSKRVSDHELFFGAVHA